MGKIAVFTIIAKNYLSYARVLMDSVRRWAPEAHRIVLLADELEGCFDPGREDFEVILSRDLSIPNSRWFHFKYTVLELSTAVKPYVLQLLCDHGFDRIVYLDPDIQVYDDLNQIFQLLDDSSIILTPHLTSPVSDELRPTELDILRSGTFNLGFIAIKNNAETKAFLAWWQDKLYDHCVVDVAKGLFVDQKWIDLAPGLFDNVRIVRDPRFNVAYWNIAQRPVRRVAERYEVNGVPLVFFHFSGFDPDNPAAFSRHQNRFRLDELGDAGGLVMEYRDLLLAAGHAESKSWPYRFARFSNGFPIPDVGRPAHHEMPVITSEVEDPFSSAGFDSFVRIWNHPLPDPGGRSSGVTRLAYRIYRSRPDVQTAMPDIFGGDLLRFLNWMLTSGRREHNIDTLFLEPISQALHLVQNGEGEGLSSRKASQSSSAVNERIVQACSHSGVWSNDGRDPLGLDNLNALVTNGGVQLRLSRLANAIYRSRPDLQSAFPDPCGADSARFLIWFLTYGQREYMLEPALTAPLQQQWGHVVKSDGAVTALRSYATLIGMRASISWRGLLKLPTGPASGPVSPRLPSPAAAESGDAPAVSQPTATDSRKMDGVNIIGYAKSEMGVGESVRCALRAARAAGVGASLKSVDAAGPYRLGDHSAGVSDDRLPYPINLFHVNADESRAVVEKLGQNCVAGRYNVGFWAWELEEFPDRWTEAFDLFDEIWTPSTFCQQAIAKKSPAPVVRMPHSIHLDLPGQAGLASFSFPSGCFTFLSIFDLLSVFERKNPLAVIEAFAKAFEANPSYHLVLKINHASERLRDAARITSAAAHLPITIIDKTIDRPEVTRLIASCDCLISLHRSEGFGLTMAEAMYLRKPVIATGYSGNLDFMTPYNSFLVEHRLVPVPDGCEPYDAGSIWAEPSIADAIEKMRLVANFPDVRTERAARAEVSIKRQLSPEVVGGMMADRLAHIRRRRFRAKPQSMGMHA